jgi:hypothetical protein
MNPDPATEWLATDKAALREAVRQAVTLHVKELRDRGVSFYGYALLPGYSLAEVNGVFAAFNGDDDIAAEHRSTEHSEYAYYRFGVHEWKHYDNTTKCFDAAESEIKRLRGEFKALHHRGDPQDDNDFFLDELEVQMNRQLFEAVFNGLRLAKEDGTFRAYPAFLCVWFNDDGNMDVIRQTVEFLNGEDVARQFAKAFC